MSEPAASQPTPSEPTPSGPTPPQPTPRGRGRRLLDTARRLGGVVRKEVIEVVRQPGLLAILVVGPLAILLLFGSGVRTGDPAVRSIFVAPDGNPEVRALVEDYAAAQDQRLTVVDVTTDAAAAQERLRDGDVQLVVVIPDADLERIGQGERAIVQVLHNLIDPLEVQAIELFTETAVDDINDLLVTLAIEETQSVAGDVVDAAQSEAATDPDLDEDTAADAESLADQADDLLDTDAEVLARPLEGEVEGIGGTVTTSQFYAPAVVALILQHLTLTFIALSVSGERTQRATELLAVSPLRPAERVAGKVLAYVLIGSALGALMLAGVVLLLGAPLRDGILPVAGVLGLELLASIGLGFVLAAIARTTTQVVQGAMLLLLLSVFFGGLLLSPERLLPWARPVGWILPMTHGISMLRDSMLRGVAVSETTLLALAALAVVTIGAGAWWMGRAERRG
jgi:ABC-2 type transport system permease protein